MKSRVLVVDDMKSNRLILGRMVESFGHPAIFASDGERALRILEDNPEIRLVLSDIDMPNLDGPALAAEVLALPAEVRPAVLIYSSYLKLNQVEALLKSGARAFLPYPFEKEAVREYLERYGAEPAGETRADPAGFI